MSDQIEELYRLKRLRDEGGITEEQYDAQRTAALTKVARRGTAVAPEPEEGYPVVMLAACAIVIALLALFVVIRFHQTPVEPSKPAHVADVQSEQPKDGVPVGMTTWDGSQSMSAAGSQDMTPHDVNQLAGDAASGLSAVANQGAPADVAHDSTPAIQAAPTSEQVVPPPAQDQVTSQPQQPPQENLPRISAVELSQAFQDNPSRAESKMAGKWFEVVGLLDHASLDIPDYPSVNLQGSDPGHDVGVNLQKESASRAGALTPGQQVTVTCEGISNMAGVPILDHCVL